jgi:hypothetical protein
MTESKLIKEFNQTGPCVLDMAEVEKAWDHRCFISQNGDDYRFIQYLRRGSSACQLKVTISPTQAKEIINHLNLVQTKSPIFVKASSWRKVGQSESDMQSKVQQEKYAHLVK